MSKFYQCYTNKFNCKTCAVQIQNRVLEICNDCDRGIEIVASACKDQIRTYKARTHHNNPICTIQEFMAIYAAKINLLLQTQQRKEEHMKVNFELSYTLVYTNGDEITESTKDVKSFTTEFRVVRNLTNVRKVCEDLFWNMEAKILQFQAEAKQCTFRNIVRFDINVCNYLMPQEISNVILPIQIAEKNAVISVTSDKSNFAWAVLAALYPEKTFKELMLNYKSYFIYLNMQNIDLPVTVDSIPQFEKINNVSVNVYGLTLEQKTAENRLTGPLYFTKNKKPSHVNLLYICKNNSWQYFYIKDILSLIKTNAGVGDGSIYYCDTCLLNFLTKESLINHIENGCNHVCTNLPDYKFENIKFENWCRNSKIPFVIYSDSESILKPIENSEETHENYPAIKTRRHVPYSFAYYIKCSYSDSFSKFEKFRGPDCAKIFVQKLVEDVKLIYKYLKDQSDEYMFEKFKHSCMIVPVFFHNLSGYDLHQFIRELAYDEHKIHVLSDPKGNYIKLTKSVLVDYTYEEGCAFVELTFLDSYRFLRSSLQNLTEKLNPNQLTEMKKLFPDNDEFNLVTRKGVFPYSYIKSFDNLNETKLPEQKEFFDDLNECEISDENYKHACNVWNTFGCKTLGEYSDLYLKTDVILLTDIFENYRSLCLTIFNLDPCYYVSATGFSWDALLKYTDVQLYYLTNADMIEFIRKGIREDFSYCARRYAIANNKYIPSDSELSYNPEKESVYVMAWEINYPHVWTMLQPLPTSNFRWLTQKEVYNLQVGNIDNESSYGYILEVDLEYSQRLHDMHNEIPFCPDKIIPPECKSNKKKVIPNLYNKTRYVVHYRNLKQAMRHGLKITKIHKVLEFQQSAWLKQFVNIFFTESIKTEFEQYFYDSILNALYYKLINCNNNFPEIHLETNTKNCLKRIAQPNFQNYSILSENLVKIQMNQLKTMYKKPIYLSFCVSELSNLLKYDFHYDFVKMNYGCKAKLLHTENHSLIYKIKTDDVYEDIYKHNTKFVTSNFDPENQCNTSLQKENMIGLMRDQNDGNVVCNYIGLNPKMYALEVIGGEVKKKAGSLKKSVVDKKISLTSYIDTLANYNNLIIKQNEFAVIDHCIYSQTIEKVALSPFSDNRFVIRDISRSLAWGHYNIEKLKNKYKPK